MPVEPPSTRWALPDPLGADDDGVVGVGADLAPGTLLAAYRRGLFPMHLDRRARLLGWWSPDPRGILPLDGFHQSRSLRRSRARFHVSHDRDFPAVIDACGAPRPTGGHWIDHRIRDAYLELHRWGWAHSVEVRDDDGALVGGLYGVAVGGLFAGESMFHRATDASKVALAHLVELLGGPRGAREGRLLDVQWVTPHLASLGCIAVPATDYQRRLAVAAALALPAAFGGPPVDGSAPVTEA